MTIDKLISRFQAADRNLRLETLLEASKRLPELPPRLQLDRDREAHRIAECQTPVFLWLEQDGGALRLYADVPKESPTVRGFLSLLVKALDGRPPAEAAALPPDLIHLMRLDDALGMMRTQGLGAITHRIRRMAASLAGPTTP